MRAVVSVSVINESGDEIESLGCKYPGPEGQEDFVSFGPIAPGARGGFSFSLRRAGELRFHAIQSIRGNTTMSVPLVQTLDGKAPVTEITLALRPSPPVNSLELVTRRPS